MLGVTRDAASLRCPGLEPKFFAHVADGDALKASQRGSFDEQSVDLSGYRSLCWSSRARRLSVIHANGRFPYEILCMDTRASRDSPVAQHIRSYTLALDDRCFRRIGMRTAPTHHLRVTKLLPWSMYRRRAATIGSRDRAPHSSSAYEGGNSMNEDALSIADASRRNVLLGGLMATFAAGLP
jgi:hypothetical protein